LALRDLTYLNRMTTVGQILPNVAHELNNALQVIGGVVEMLGLRADDLPADVQEKVTRIGAQTRRATEMLRDLVIFARGEDGGERLVDLTRLVERSLAFRRYHLARARIAVTVDAPAAGRALARLDASYLQLILLNLLINAEHSLVGRSDGRITVCVLTSGADAEVRVLDNGSGIPDDTAKRVTEAFFTTKVPAAGLGLTVAAGLARDIGGSLVVRSNPGGTEAVVSLPGRAVPG
jgi:two-component system C4-dicarboxylate transport sensor histidine kinase DctB